MFYAVASLANRDNAYSKLASKLSFLILPQMSVNASSSMWLSSKRFLCHFVKIDLNTLYEFQKTFMLLLALQQ